MLQGKKKENMYFWGIIAYSKLHVAKLCADEKCTKTKQYKKHSMLLKEAEKFIMEI